MDALVRSGALIGYGFREGHVPGGEIAGTVIATGPGVKERHLGRRVWASTGGGGGYVERIAVPACAAVPIPDPLSSIDAVTLNSSGIVARFGLRYARLAQGETILIRGASGGIGIMAVQMASHAGAGSIAVTTSSPQRGERLSELGATFVLDRSAQTPDGPAGFDVILDIVGGPDLPRFFSKLNAEGRIIAVGATAGPPPEDFGMSLYAAFQRSLSFAVFSAATVSETERRTAVSEIMHDAAHGGLCAVVDDVLPLHRAADAHHRLDAGDVFGRLALVPD